MRDEPLAEMLTLKLRYSTDAVFRRLSELLASSGIDVQKAVVAQLFPDDVDQEFGVLLTGKGKSSRWSSTTAGAT